MLSKLSRLKIYAVGSTVVDEDFVVGIEVLVDPKVLTNAPIIDLSVKYQYFWLVFLILFMFGNEGSIH